MVSEQILPHRNCVRFLLPKHRGPESAVVSMDGIKVNEVITIWSILWSTRNLCLLIVEFLSELISQKQWSVLLAYAVLGFAKFQIESGW